MKANIHYEKKLNNEKGGGPFHGHELRLTIGLIVKNEEKTLDKCLSSLVPLLKAVPSELIITDTGSTDRTLEIAQKYTDNIIHFEWCDDFSAARNTGLDAARGEWFLYLDGDEWFDDVTELIYFFSSGECDQYGAMAYIQRNYNDFLGDSHADDYVCRSFRTLNTRFHNKVHEDFPFYSPVKVLETFVHHYGYIFHNEEERRKKLERNEELLKNELKTNPDDLKAILQYTLQIVTDYPEEAAKYSEHGLNVVQKNNSENNDHIETRFALHLIEAYFNCNRYTDVCIIADKALKKERKQGLFHLEIYRLCQMAAWQQKNYEDAVKYGEFYRELYTKYQNGDLDRTPLVMEVFHFLTPDQLQRSFVMTGQAYQKLHKTEEALDCLNSLDLTVKDSMQNGSLQLCTDLAAEAEDWSIPVEFYQRVLVLGDEKKTGALLAHLNAYYNNFPLKQREFTQAFAEAEGDGMWLWLCRIRAAEQNDDRKHAAELLDEFCQKPGQWDACFADILWYAVKEKKNLLPFLPHIDYDEIPAMAMQMQGMHEDYSETLCGYFELFSFENPKMLFCATCLLERTVLSRNAKKNEGLYQKVIAVYLENVSKFVRAVYRTEVLTESGLSALPSCYRFGYYAGLALDAKRMGDDAAYLANLRLSLKEYPTMKDCIKFLLKKFEEEQKKRDVQMEEFSTLAKQVKQNIEQLIARGDLKQAGAYTLQLVKLIPEDDDIRRYRKLTGTEPTMAELASCLPQ